jgi:hypothetical protein
MHGWCISTVARHRQNYARIARHVERPWSLSIRIGQHGPKTPRLRPARIEKLAGTSTQRVLTEVCRASVSVTIRKPVALDHGEPDVPRRRAPESCYENRVFRPAWID